MSAHESAARASGEPPQQRAKSPAQRGGNAAGLLALQRLAGNKATGGLIRGASMQPSALAAGLAQVDASAQNLVGEADRDGNALASAAAVPVGPAAAAVGPERQAAPAAVPVPAPPVVPARGGDGPVSAAAVNATIERFTTGAEGSLGGATVSADSLARGTPTPVMAPDAAVPVVAPGPPVATPTTSAAPELPGIPDGEAAALLDAGFGPQLAERAALAETEAAEADTEHGRMLAEADRGHRAAVAQEESSAGARATAIRGEAEVVIGAERQTWLADNNAATAAARAEIAAERGTVAAGAGQEAAAADTGARKMVEDARRRADGTAAPAQTYVQRSWWDRAVSWGSGLVAGARDLVGNAMNSARQMLAKAREAIGARMRSFADFVGGAVSRASQALAAAASRAGAAIRTAASAARSALNSVVTGLAAVGRGLRDRLGAAVRRAGGWLAGKLRSAVAGLAAFGRRVLSLATAAKELLFVNGKKVLHGIGDAVSDPAAFLRPFTSTVGGWISALPAKTEEQYQAHVAPVLTGGPAPAADTGAVVQRQAAAETTAAPAAPTHADIVWEYIKARVSYMGAHWTSVIGDILLEIFVPGLSFYRHVPPMLRAVGEALTALWQGRFSDAVDAGLKAARELSAILGTLFAQVSIAAFIAGSIIGTPIVGEAAMMAVGLGLLAADVTIQGASILKAWSNLNKEGRTTEQLDEDYSTIADSSVSLGMTLALILIAAAGKMLATRLLARFPRMASGMEAVLARMRRRLGITPGVAAEVEAFRARLREKLGLRPRRPNSPNLDVPKVREPGAPATEFRGRADLLPHEQLAFDRWVEVQRAKNGGTLPEGLRTRLEKADAATLRKMTKTFIDEQADVTKEQGRRDRLVETNKSDPLNPTFAKNEHPDPNVSTHWNDRPPSTEEIDLGKHIAREHGEPVALFGDDIAGIDGVVGNPRRPLQLKAKPSTLDAVFDSAVSACEKARTHGYGNVEVHIKANGLTVAQVREYFAGRPGRYLDGSGVRRVVIWCTDGTYTPLPNPPLVPTPPVRPRTEEEEE